VAAAATPPRRRDPVVAGNGGVVVAGCGGRQRWRGGGGQLWRGGGGCSEQRWRAAGSGACVFFIFSEMFAVRGRKTHGKEK
jgi:hypothetical protein